MSNSLLIDGSQAMETWTNPRRARPSILLSKQGGLILLLVVIVGIAKIPYPFDSDQSIFLTGARILQSGGVLYRDYWEVKQPGIYWFYLLAGSIFGFSEPGIFAFELLYLLAFSVVCVALLERYFSEPLIAASLPLFTVAFYYGATGPWQRTQVEALVGFPLFLAIYSASRAEGSEPKSSAVYLSLSGLFGGLVLLFKFVFLPILLYVWIVGYVRSSRNAESTRSRLRRALAWVLFLALGLSLPLLMTSTYFAFRGALHELLWTTFQYPRRAVTALYERRFISLRAGHVWFIQRCAPSMALSVVALCPAMPKRLDPLFKNLFIWVIGGFFVIQFQVLSWWTYHYVLLFTPLGILAARGVDLLWAHLRRQWIDLPKYRIALPLGMALGFLYSPILYALAYNTLDVLRQGIPVTEAQLRKVQISRPESRYREVLEEVQFLGEPSSTPGSIYVCGPHLFYLLSGRKPAILLDGWALWFYFPEYERELVDQLRRARPAYIFIDSEYYEDLIHRRFAGLESFVKHQYRISHTSNSGIWYSIAN
jgi:hypothetical protein